MPAAGDHAVCLCVEFLFPVAALLIQMILPAVGFPGIHIKFCQKFAVPPVFQRIFPEVLPDIVLLELVVIGCQLRPDLRDLRLRVEVPEGHIQCFALQVGAVDTEIDVICPVFFPDICCFAVAVQRLAAAVSTL